MDPQVIYPLISNPKTNEPFLQLPEPFSNIIITPVRPDTDPQEIVPILNDPLVHVWITGAAFPYELHLARDSANKRKVLSDKILEELRTPTIDENHEPKGPTGLKLVSGCPVTAIREVKEDGTDIYIGNVGCRRSDYYHILAREEAKRLTDINVSRKIDDPDIIWHMGDYLASSHHGRGIMTAVIHTIIHSWMIPRLGARHIMVNTNKGNIASVRVFEKNGFRMIMTLEDCKENPESKGGGMHGLHVLEWKMEDANKGSM